MNALYTWLAERASHLLNVDERDAVRGDLAESGETGREALGQTLGLVVRRQLALCGSWRPWLALALLTPLGLRLTRETARWAHTGAIYLWLYAGNWRAADMANSGFWRLLAREALTLLLPALLLFAASAGVGVGLALIARRSAFAAAALYVATLWFASFTAPPHGDFGANAAAFQSLFYRALFPAIVQLALVIAPALIGISQTRRLAEK